MGVQEEPHSPRNTGDFGNTVQWMGVPPRGVGKEVRLCILLLFFFICYTGENKMEKTNKQTENNLLEESVSFLSFLV